jgi:hypothetical protein
MIFQLGFCGRSGVIGSPLRPHTASFANLSYAGLGDPAGRPPPAHCSLYLLIRFFYRLLFPLAFGSPCLSVPLGNSFKSLLWRPLPPFSWCVETTPHFTATLFPHRSVLVPDVASGKRLLQKPVGLTCNLQQQHLVVVLKGCRGRLKRHIMPLEAARALPNKQRLTNKVGAAAPRRASPTAKVYWR